MIFACNRLFGSLGKTVTYTEYYDDYDQYYDLIYDQYYDPDPNDAAYIMYGTFPTL